MSNPTIEERVARLERHAGLPMGVKEGEARARATEYRYAVGSITGTLYRERKDKAKCEALSGGAWRLVTGSMDVIAKHGEEITESEAVSRFGREILDDQDVCHEHGTRLRQHSPPDGPWLCPDCKDDSEDPARPYEVCRFCDAELEDGQACPNCTQDETPHARALRELDLKPGDRVRVDRKPSESDEWMRVTGWDEKMDAAIGRIGRVIAVDEAWGPQLDIDCVEDKEFFYPAHALTVVSRAGEDQSEDEKPDPPKTLADVPPHVLCELDFSGTKGPYCGWRTTGNKAILCRGHRLDGAWVDDPPSVLNVTKVLGPVHICTSDQAARVKELEGELADKTRALPAMSFPIEVANALMEIRHKLRPDARRAVIRVADYYSRQAQGGEG